MISPPVRAAKVMNSPRRPARAAILDSFVGVGVLDDPFLPPPLGEVARLAVTEGVSARGVFIYQRQREQRQFRF